MTQTEVGAPSGVFGSFQADCYAVPIPDIPEAACWLRAPERLVLEQHVQLSSNHLGKPQARQYATSTRQSSVTVNFRPKKKKKVLWNFHSHKGPIFSTHFCKARPLFLGPDTLHIPCNLMMLCNLSLCPIARWNQDERKLEKPQEHPWDIDACLGKHLP